ncbi:MAG TPA: hypothetical protein VG406_03895 [Isosphaeraceae bacterium]|jgi:hypothetical protein|nr:hypothetical protein [Isosphaeraceae bacterium]
MPDKVIEVFGEGKTDIGPISKIYENQVELPVHGVVPVLVHRLCGRPDAMRVKRRALPFLQGKGLSGKVRFARRQAPYNGSAGLVIVLDTEGEHPARLDGLTEIRDSFEPGFPMAIGVAHPCIESWLLTDGSAILRALKLPQTPDLPAAPESLPAPQRDKEENPKRHLARCINAQQAALSSEETTRIAREMKDMDLVRRCCPLSFGPFANEVQQRIAPIFRSEP